MWRFTEVADWFDRKRAQSDKIIDQWVESRGFVRVCPRICPNYTRQFSHQHSNPSLSRPNYGYAF